MSENKLEETAVEPTKDSETIQSSSNGVSITKEDLVMLYNLAESFSLTKEDVKHRFSFYIPHLIENVYQYNVKIKTKKSEGMRRFVFYEFVSKNFPNFKIAYDGVQFAYSPQRLPSRKLECETKIIHPGSKVEHEFMVTIQEENDCEIPIRRCIEQYINNSEDTEQTRAVHAFNTIVNPEWTRPRCAEISRSFFVLADGMSDFRPPSEYLHVIWKRIQSDKGISSEAITWPSNPLHGPRTLSHYLRELWKYFNWKKGSQPSRDQFEIVSSEEIMARASSCYPNKRFIRNSLRNMKRFDMIDAAEKSLEFREIAKKYFPSEKQLYIFSSRMTLKDYSRYLGIFGESIKRIWWEDGSQKEDEAYSKLIAQFCGKSLIELRIRYHNISSNELSKFQMLEKLCLIDVSLTELGSVPLLPSLRKLSLARVRLTDQLWQNFPKLESISLCDVDGLTDEMLVEFQRQNPQLQKMYLDFLDGGLITSSVLKDIGARTPNIVKFKCNFKDDHEIQANMLHLSGLPKLKILNIMCFESSFSAKPLIESLANKRVPIEYLRIKCSNDVLENLPLLKRLKTAYFNECSQKALIDSIAKIRNLKNIWIGDVTAATVPGILQVLKSTRKLEMTLHTDVLVITSNEYRSLLTVAKRQRHRFTLMIRDAYIGVDEDVLEKNRYWLNIGHD